MRRINLQGFVSAGVRSTAIVKCSFRSASVYSSAGACIDEEVEDVDGNSAVASSRTVANVGISERVDQLLAYTRELMGDPTATATTSAVTSRRHVVAFSGGVDSSLVAALLYRCKTDCEQVHAILGLSAAVPQEQVDTARTIADDIGIPLSLIRTSEGLDETYLANEGQACLACKTHLYSAMRAVVDHISDEASEWKHAGGQSVQLYNGTNADDLTDPTRLGLIAAQKFQVLSPLQHLSKGSVREISRHLGLRNWNYAASPCLRSRLALGVPATTEHLQRIDAAERRVRERLAFAFDETSNLRVRLLSGNHARIELDITHIDVAKDIDWATMFRTEFGFSSVSISPFRSGSVARRKEDPAVENIEEAVITRHA